MFLEFVARTVQTLRVRMFAGPNGSGKTTLTRSLAKEFSPNGAFQLNTYINADDLLRALIADGGIDLRRLGFAGDWAELQKRLRTLGRLTFDHPFFSAAHIVDSRLVADANVCDAYVTASVADVLRQMLVEQRRSFSFETVMSHRSKVDFFCQAKDTGYRTYLYFVATDSPDVNIDRVEGRAADGEHFVEPSILVKRYERSLALLPTAMACAHRAYLFDNSGEAPRCVIEQTPDGSILKFGELPAWCQFAAAV